MCNTTLLFQAHKGDREILIPIQRKETNFVAEKELYLLFCDGFFRINLKGEVLE